MKNKSRLEEPIVFVPTGEKAEITKEEKEKSEEWIKKMKNWQLLENEKNKK